MTREEALQILDTIPTIGEQVDALEMAIHALSQEPCDDAISREDAIKALQNVVCESMAIKSRMVGAIEDLPSVTHKSGKWDRLYSWLNDMRLDIAPDETVTDIDERHCRESQTDILDEIMEWMIKAERR